jgi:hypothetical protein
MFSGDRVFSVFNQNTGAQEWYFQAREGDIGPYQTKKEAGLMLSKFIKVCIETGCTGGRGQGNIKNTMSTLQIQHFMKFAQGELQWN